MTRILRVIAVSALLVVSLVVGAVAVPINYIVNGGFETGDYTGWTSAGCGPFGVATSFAGWLPHSGNFFSAEGGVGCDHTLSQTFADVAGQPLHISFYMGSDGATPNDLNVSWNGALIFTATDIASTQPFYTHYTFNVLATGTDMLTLGIRNDPAWQALDDVSVTSVIPEPGTLILMGSGLLGMAGVVRRKLSL